MYSTGVILLTFYKGSESNYIASELLRRWVRLETKIIPIKKIQTLYFGLCKEWEYRRSCLSISILQVRLSTIRKNGIFKMLEPNVVGRSNNILSSKKRHQHRCYQLTNLVIFSLGSDISKIWVYKYSILSWPFWCFWWYDAHNENILHRKRLSTQRDDVFLRLPDTDYAHSNFFLHTDHCCTKKSRLE